MKKQVFRVLAWVGAIITLGATVVTGLILTVQIFGFDNILVPFPFLAAGTILALIGGIGGKPACYWGTIIVTGLLWLALPAFGLFIAIAYSVLGLEVWGLWFGLSLPGFICVITGLIVKYLRKKQEAPANV